MYMVNSQILLQIRVVLEDRVVLVVLGLPVLLVYRHHRLDPLIKGKNSSNEIKCPLKFNHFNWCRLSSPLKLRSVKILNLLILVIFAKAQYCQLKSDTYFKHKVIHDIYTK